VPPLAETQGAMRAAIIERRPEAILAQLTGSSDPTYRLSIHQRHYEASLAKAIVTRFPAVEWLVGSAFIGQAATAFVRQFPPVAPCIAEYGEGFPRFLAGLPSAKQIPWIEAVGCLDWHLGTIAVAIAAAPIGMDRLAGLDGAPEALVLSLQPGLRFMDAAWPVDDLVKLYLSDAAPEQFALDPADVYLEIRGARGAFQINRLSASTHAFRATLAARQPLGAALEAAVARDPAFDPGAALGQLFGEGLVTAVDAPNMEPKNVRH
jgi:Putative DNA-binding domain